MRKDWGHLLPMALFNIDYVAASKLQDGSIDIPVAKQVIPIHYLSYQISVSGREEHLSRRNIGFPQNSASLRNVRDIFGIDVRIGDTISILTFDTGAPFTWVLSPGFECVGMDGKQLSVIQKMESGHLRTTTNYCPILL